MYGHGRQGRWPRRPRVCDTTRRGMATDARGDGPAGRGCADNLRPADLLLGRDLDLLLGVVVAEGDADRP